MRWSTLSSKVRSGKSLPEGHVLPPCRDLPVICALPGLPVPDPDPTQASPLTLTLSLWPSSPRPTTAFHLTTTANLPHCQFAMDPSTAIDCLA